MKLTAAIGTTALIAASAVLGVASSAQPPLPLNPLELSPHHVAISVANLKAESAWYAKVLGFDKVFCSHTADQQGCWMWIPGFRFDLIQQKGSSRIDKRVGVMRQGFLHVSLQTPLIQEALKQLRADGVAVQVFRYRNGRIMRLLIEDPEGNQIELHAYQGGPAISPGYWRW
jgi:catechol 2,3-dioxygenase-like lactoylglutathione lyase family enzyme